MAKVKDKSSVEEDVEQQERGTFIQPPRKADWQHLLQWKTRQRNFEAYIQQNVYNRRCVQGVLSSICIIASNQKQQMCPSVKMCELGIYANNMGETYRHLKEWNRPTQKRTHQIIPVIQQIHNFYTIYPSLREGGLCLEGLDWPPLVIRLL